MDLGAYAQIEDLEYLMKENGIEVPRLRGLRNMKDEKIIRKDYTEESARAIGLWRCERWCRSFFDPRDGMELSERTDAIVKKYMIVDRKGNVIDINWKNVHGSKRKCFKYEMRHAKRRVEEQDNTFNKYCGQNVLYIHARIGGSNWNHYGGEKITKQPWFIEKVDDAFDNTYCDIYARIGDDMDLFS